MSQYYFAQKIILFTLLFYSGDLVAKLTEPSSQHKEVNRAALISSPPSCIGPAGTIARYIYENIGGDIEAMRHEPSFPQSPSYIEYLSALSSSLNYRDHYGSFIRGFIRAPETGDYVFNITGDDNCEFYLSPDSTTTGLVLKAEVPGWSGYHVHDIYPEQTSDTFQLVQGEYYYFELYQEDGTGGDHVSLHWKIPSNFHSGEWTVVHGTYVHEYICDTICPVAGTPCDDGDPNTENDQADGACHCMGTPVTLPFTCIGERGSVKALYYDGISGDEVSDLLPAAHYPLMPNRAEILTKTEGPSANSSQYGTRIRGYLYVPETGDYIFNVTSDDEAQLFLSANEIPNRITDLIAHNPHAVDDYHHESDSLQTSDTLQLTGGTFYSIEILHKEHYGGDDYHIFWKTPFARDTFWHLIGAGHLFQYNCELACIPQGTVCDDGDANTFDDQYDANCNCVGTPCSDPLCTNQLGYTPYDECASQDKHSNNPNDAWISCAPQPNPNAPRGDSHWILYDFGMVYMLDNAQIWNYNAEGATGQGFNTVVIDYSIDGSDWMELGTFNWAEASGNADYQGFLMSEFSGVNARYVLITALDNFESSDCMGLSEVSFAAFQCEVAGTPCDDGIFETINDTYDGNCGCTGIPITNTCFAQDSIINDNPIASSSFEIEATITAAGKINNGSEVFFIAGGSVKLMPGFKAAAGSHFLASIIPCNLPKSEVAARSEDLEEENEAINSQKLALQVSPNPTKSWTKIRFNLPESGKVRLGVFSSSGQLVTWLIQNTEQESGNYSKDFPAHQLAGGVYFITLQTETEIISKRLVIVD